MRKPLAAYSLRQIKSMDDCNLCVHLSEFILAKYSPYLEKYFMK